MSHTTTTTKSTTKRPAYRGKYPHRICTVASMCPDESGRARLFVATNDGTQYRFSAGEAAALFGADRMPRIGDEFPQWRAFELGFISTVHEDGATLHAVDDGDWHYVMRGATGTHTLYQSTSGVDLERLRAHWAGFLAAHRAARAAAKRPPIIRSVLRLRANGAYAPMRSAAGMLLLAAPEAKAWHADHADMRDVLGLGRKAKLPAGGMPPRSVDGVTVYVRPRDAADGKRRPHRVRAICPLCGADISAGRLHQHVCAPL